MVGTNTSNNGSENSGEERKSVYVIVRDLREVVFSRKNNTSEEELSSHWFKIRV